MKHASTRMIFSYWDALRGERAAPERGEIEPGEIRHVLADTFILEIGEARRPEFRLAGTRLCALFGRELKGQGFLELWPAQAAPAMRRHLDVVIDETAGLVVGLSGATAQGNELDLELILLPLRHRGKPHARVLGALSPAAIPNWLGFEAIDQVAATSLRVIWPSGRERGASFGVGDPQERRRRFVVHDGGRTGSLG